MSETENYMIRIRELVQECLLRIAIGNIGMAQLDSMCEMYYTMVEGRRKD